jgi:hypothetical protein
MQIELNHTEAEAFRELPQQKVSELAKEINRTDSLAFKNNNWSAQLSASSARFRLHSNARQITASPLRGRAPNVSGQMLNEPISRESRHRFEGPPGSSNKWVASGTI